MKYISFNLNFIYLQFSRDKLFFESILEVYIFAGALWIIDTIVDKLTNRFVVDINTIVDKLTNSCLSSSASVTILRSSSSSSCEFRLFSKFFGEGWKNKKITYDIVVLRNSSTTSRNLKFPKVVCPVLILTTHSSSQLSIMQQNRYLW